MSGDSPGLDHCQHLRPAISHYLAAARYFGQRKKPHIFENDGTSLTDASGSVTGYAFDHHNRLITDSDTMNAAATTAWQFSYDALCNIVKSRMAPSVIVQQPISWTGSLAAGDALIDWDGDGQGERYDVSTITVASGDVIEVSVSARAAAFVPVL